MIKLLLLFALFPSLVLAQTPTPTPNPEVLAAEQLNISVYELRASRLLNLISQLLQVKKQEREGQVAGLGVITEQQKAALRTQRLSARAQLRTMCNQLQEVE